MRQRTQNINALRGHLAEYGLITGQGIGQVSKLIDMIESPVCELPGAARAMLRVLSGIIAVLESQVKLLDQEIARRARTEDVPRRLMTIPGIGPITATALAALAPPPEVFRKGRDFAAWLGLTPLQKTTGGKQRLGATSKMGERTLRRLHIIGASAVVCQATRRGAPQGSWLARMLARKPRMLVITALANKMARTVWALMAKNEIYRAPVVSKTTNKFSPEVRERAVRRSACSRRSVAAGKAERGRDTPPSATA